MPAKAPTTQHGSSASPSTQSQTITQSQKGRRMTKKTIDLGKIEYLQILDEHGVVDPELDPKLEPSELLRVYRAMVLTRKFDVRMLAMQRQGQMGTFAPGVGQEATQIGQVHPLQSVDWFAPSYRSFGADLARLADGPAPPALGWIRGRVRDSAGRQ